MKLMCPGIKRCTSCRTRTSRRKDDVGMAFLDNEMTTDTRYRNLNKSDN